MAPSGAKQGEEKGVGEVVGDLWQLLRDYAKQETIDPLRSVGRFLGFGLAGAVLLALGILFIALAVLRALQTETGSALTGVLDFVPYLVAFVIAAIVILVAVMAIKKPVRAEEGRR